MFVDTHMHEMTCSKDSFLKLEEMVEIAREKGLGAICITDHDDMGLKEYAAEYSKKTGFPIFVGIEFGFILGHQHVHMFYADVDLIVLRPESFIDGFYKFIAP